MDTLKDVLIRASVARCESEIADAYAKIQLYLSTPVGVGEHPDIVSEILSACEAGANAQEKLDFLKKASPRAQVLQSTMLQSTG